MSLTSRDQANIARTRELLFRCFAVISCICLMIQILSIPYKIYSLTSLSNQVLLISWLLIWFYTVITQLFKKVSYTLICVLSIVLMSLLSFGMAAVFNTGLFAQIGKLLGFFMLPMMIYCIRSVGITDKTRKAVLICNFIASLLYIYLYHSPLRYSFTTKYGVVNIDSVTLGFPNPNQAATMLFACTVLLLASLFFFKSKLIKVLLLADIVYLSYIMFGTDSRTSVLLLAAFVVLALISIRRQLPKFITEFSLLSPVIYVVLAVAVGAALDFIQISGHNIFTGREEYYARYFDNLDPISFLFGDFAEFQFENLHNGYISIAATVGIVALTVYYVFLRKTLLDARRTLTRRFEKVAYCGLLCIVVYTCTEAGLLIGGAMYAFLISMTFFMMPTVNDEDAVCEEEIEQEEIPDLL